MKSVLFTGSSGQLGFACKEIFPSKFNSLFTSKNAQGFNRSNLANMMGYGDFTPEGQRQSVAQQTAETMGMSMDDLPDAVSKALTKDYSGLMKKLDEKKQEKGGYRP